MRIQVEKFLALTALLAAGSVAGTGCVVEDTDTNTDAGVSGGGGAGGSSTGGAGGSSTGGAAGGGGAAGSSTGGAAGGGGAAGAGGGGGSSGSDGGACLGDTGTEIADCGQLPYASVTCGDAGTETPLKPLGYDLCAWTMGYGRLGIQQPMWDCLKAITGDPCSDTAAQKCADDVFAKACDRDAIPDGDGGTFDVCLSVTASCSGPGGVTQAECEYVINAASASAAASIWACYEQGTGNCRDDFLSCTGLP